MRIDVKKFIFLGLTEDKTAFFAEAQKQGFIQFHQAFLRKGHLSEEVQLFSQSIRILREAPLEKAPLNAEAVDLRPVAKHIIELKNRLDNLDEEIRLLKQEIARISVLGNFSLEDVAYLRNKGCVVQFFASKSLQRSRHLENPGLLYLHSANDLDYFVSIADKEVAFEALSEMKIDFSKAEGKKKLAELESTRHTVQQELLAQSCFNERLHEELLNVLNQESLQEAEEGSGHVLDESLFTATGWVPSNKIKELQKFCIHFSEVAIDPNDTPPTYLQNENWSQVGEDLVGIYDTPSTQDKDPSLWVLIGFLIFFSMIIGDGGYGSIYLGLALYLRYRFPEITGVKKRVLNLFTLLSVGCIAWGFLSSSFFGITLAQDHPFRSVSLVDYLANKKMAYHSAEQDAVSDQILLELALFVGVLHIIFGLLRYMRRTPSHIGWVIFLIGAYLYFPMFLQVPSLLNYVFHVPYVEGGQIGLYMMASGVFLSMTLAVIRNGWLGLTEIMNLIQVFADVLSYLRLYALGLAGAILSSTINDIALGLPAFLAFGLIVVGHLINMVLGIMGGVIHGLRLNFLEWYHYSFEGGGRKFKPLRLQK